MFCLSAIKFSRYVTFKIQKSSMHLGSYDAAFYNIIMYDTFSIKWCKMPHTGMINWVLTSNTFSDSAKNGLKKQITKDSFGVEFSFHFLIWNEIDPIPDLHHSHHHPSLLPILTCVLYPIGSWPDCCYLTPLHLVFPWHPHIVRWFCHRLAGCCAGHSGIGLIIYLSIFHTTAHWLKFTLQAWEINVNRD